MRIFKKTTKFLLVFITITAWFFSGWPPLVEFRIQNLEYRIPPKIKEVQAAVTFVAAGSFAGNATTNSQAITAPACAANDILIAVVINKALTNTIQAPDGTWTQIYQAAGDCTTAADDHRAAIFWKKATGSGGSFTFTKTTDDNLLFGGAITAWRGVNIDSPLDATAVASQVNAAAADNVTFPAFDPTGTNSHILFVAVYGNDATTFAAAMSSDTNPDCTKRLDVESSTGNDVSIAITAGDTTDGANIASRTWASASTTDAGSTAVVFGLKPIAVPTITTQAASSIEATTATGNGNITDTGGINASAWGVCYKTSSGCTTADSVAAGSGTGGTGAFTASMTGLTAGTTYYIKAYANNSAGTSYGGEVTILTKPAAPTDVVATDGTYGDKVTITWTKSTGATGYRVYRDGGDISGLLGDVATYDDAGAGAPTITPGSAVASDGTSTNQVNLSLSGTSANNGTTHTYKAVASNATGNSADSVTNTGYRGCSLTYQWQRSAADSDADYSDIAGATTASYADTGAPADGSGRYYKCILNATGASQQISTADRGYRAVISISVTTSGTISYGTLSFGVSKSTIDLGSTQTVRNDGNVAEDFTIKTSAASGGTGWALGSSAGANIFVHEFSSNGGGLWTKFTTADEYSPTALATNVAVNGTQNFDLRITAPTSSDAVQKTITVTILATQH